MEEVLRKVATWSGGSDTGDGWRGRRRGIERARHGGATAEWAWGGGDHGGINSRGAEEVPRRGTTL